MLPPVGVAGSANLSVPPRLGVTVVAVAAVVVFEVCGAAEVVEVCGAAEVVVLLELQPTKATPSNRITDRKAKRSFFNCISYPP